jgi:hypothetical protein
MRTLSIFLLLSLAAISTKAGALSGTVKDSEGAAIAGAHIVIHQDTSGDSSLRDNKSVPADITVVTDGSGVFTVELPPGFYDVFVAANSFSPHCAVIRIKAAGSLKYSVKLKVSPAISKVLD